MRSPDGHASLCKMPHSGMRPFAIQRQKLEWPLEKWQKCVFFIPSEINRGDAIQFQIASRGLFCMGRSCDHSHSEGFGGGRPSMLRNFKILKRFKVLENESIFQESRHFSSQKNPFLVRKISNKLTSNIFTKFTMKILYLIFRLNPWSRSYTSLCWSGLTKA